MAEDIVKTAHVPVSFSWGGTSGTFTGIDLFGRIIDQRWQNSIGGTPADIDRYQYTYDQNSNRLTRTNTVNTGLNEVYTYDVLNRLTNASPTKTYAQQWNLDATGNWSNFYEGVSGGTLTQSRTANTVNEITNITASGGTPVWVTPVYDAAGNTTSFPQPYTLTSAYTATYDAWNRMTVVQASSVNVAAFVYDGRNRRITQKTYTSGTLTETREFYFTNAWQDIEEQVSGSMVDQYVYGARYIDELVCRDDSNPARYYVAQDANFNVTSICDTSGTVDERYRYQPYGQQTVMNASWTVLSGSAYDWVVGFQGLMLEVATGLIYVRNRWLHAELGIWISRDPVGYQGGLNLYEYCDNNPINYTDPFGLFSPSDPFCVALKGRIYGKIAEIAERNLDIVKDILNLPRWHTPGMRLRDSIEGHWDIIRQLWKDLQSDIVEYKQRCSDDDKPPPCPPIVPIPIPIPIPPPVPVPVQPKGYWYIDPKTGERVLIVGGLVFVGWEAYSLAVALGIILAPVGA